MSRSERISLWLQSRADSRGGLIAMFVWALAEAFVWPIIPDASLALLVAARPRRWLPLGAAAVAGTVTAGVLGVLAGAADITWSLPLTTPKMHAAAQGWLAAGPGGLVHQPLSGVPYKVFVAAAPDAAINPWAFASATLQYRAPRLLIVAAVTAALAALGWRFLPATRQPAVHVAVTAIGTLALFAGLAAVVIRWS